MGAEDKTVSIFSVRCTAYGCGYMGREPRFEGFPFLLFYHKLLGTNEQGL